MGEINRTKYPTTGRLCGPASRMVEIPKGTPCSPTGEGDYFADQWGFLPPIDHWDAEYYGIRIQGEHVE